MTGEFCYRAFGLVIRSEIELPELTPSTNSNPDVVIRLGSVPEDIPRITPDEELALQHRAAGFLVRGGRDVVVDVRSEADSASLRVLLLGRVMALLFRQRGWLPLHASGVLVNNQCVLFLGNQRAGKSTTAAAFHAQGHRVVTDDVAPVRVDARGCCILQSAWSYVRLRADTLEVLNSRTYRSDYQGGKHRYDLDAREGGEVYPVRCAYAIEFGDAISAEPLDVMRAIPLLSRYCFVRHHQISRAALQDHVRDCSAVSARIPVRKLIRPRALAALPDLVRFVEHDLANLPAGSYR